MSIFLNSSSQLWDLESFLNSICVQLFATPWTVAHQAPLSMELSRQEYRSGYHSLLQRIFPTQVRNPDPGIKPWSWADSLPSEQPGKPLNPKAEAKTQTNYWYIKIYEGKTQTVYTEASMSIIFGSNQEPLEVIRQPTAIFLPGKSHGQRSLEGCSLWSHKESDTT